MLRLALAIACVLSICSCQKEKNSQAYYWVETYCADPWNTNDNNSDKEVENAVIDYLDDRNIKVFDVSIKHEEALIELCLACQCTTGRRITVTVDQENKIEEIGFKKY